MAALHFHRLSVIRIKQMQNLKYSKRKLWICRLRQSCQVWICTCTVENRWGSRGVLVAVFQKECGFQFVILLSSPLGSADRFHLMISRIDWQDLSRIELYFSSKIWAFDRLTVHEEQWKLCWRSCWLPNALHLRDLAKHAIKTQCNTVLILASIFVESLFESWTKQTRLVESWGNRQQKQHLKTQKRECGSRAVVSIVPEFSPSMATGSASTKRWRDLDKTARDACVSRLVKRMKAHQELLKCKKSTPAVEVEIEQAKCLSSLERLADECILLILSFVSVGAIVALSQACKRLHAVTQDERIWKNLCDKTWGALPDTGSAIQVHFRFIFIAELYADLVDGQMVLWTVTFRKKYRRELYQVCYVATPV